VGVVRWGLDCPSCSHRWRSHAPSRYVATVVTICERLIDRARYAQACAVAETAVKKLTERGSAAVGCELALAQVMVLESQCLRHAGRVEAALEVALKARGICADALCGPVEHIEHLECALAVGIGQHTCGQVHEALGTYREALAVASRLTKGPRTAKVHSQLLTWCGKLLLSHGDSDAGMEVVRQALDLHHATFGASRHFHLSPFRRVLCSTSNTSQLHLHRTFIITLCSMVVWQGNNPVQRVNRDFERLSLPFWEGRTFS
jgi:hypothetical protein